MKNFLSARSLCALAGGCLVALSLGCGWSSRQSRANTSTGVSESGYPAAKDPLDPGSPALASMKRDEKKDGAEKKQEAEKEAAREPYKPGATAAMTHAPGRTKTAEEK